MKNHYFQMDDRALWLELRSGSLIALEVIYRRYYSLLLNYGMKCTPDDDMVRDCIQELFVKLAKSSNLSDTEYPRSYLLKSLRNMINDKSTSARSQVECFSFNDEIFSDIMDDDSFEKIFGNSDEDLRKKKALVQALSQLTSQQKHILYLRYIKGLSHKEVAEAMDMNVQSSMNLLSRSVSKLREILATHSIMCITFLQWMQIILNSIRANRDCPDYNNDVISGRGYTDLLDILLEERRIELAYEGHRALDLFRNKRNLNRNYPGSHLVNKDSYKEIKWSDKNIIELIPLNQINAQGNLVQNEI